MLGGNKVISLKERLALTIRFLATGETYRSLSYQFRISTRAISYIIKEVCEAIIKNMRNIYLKVPSSPEEWLTVAEKFESRWQFPNCIGAMDGKHIVMQPPGNSGSYYYNYKHTNSIILMAVAGPNYECLYYDIGTNGRVNEGGVWNKCGLAKALEEGKMNFPLPCCLPGGNEQVPYVLIGDDAFALKPYLMKPYAQQSLVAEKRVYNHRHSRARRLSGNLFGILANRWRFMRNVLLLHQDVIEILVSAALVLHNFLRESDAYCPTGLLDTESVTGEVLTGWWCQDLSFSAMGPGYSSVY